jgi:hypothetical protein
MKTITITEAPVKISDRALTIARNEIARTDSTMGYHVQMLINDHEAQLQALVDATAAAGARETAAAVTEDDPAGASHPHKKHAGKSH